MFKKPATMFLSAQPTGKERQFAKRGPSGGEWEAEAASPLATGRPSRRAVVQLARFDGASTRQGGRGGAGGRSGYSKRAGGRLTFWGRMLPDAGRSWAGCYCSPARGGVMDANFRREKFSRAAKTFQGTKHRARASSSSIRTVRWRQTGAPAGGHCTTCARLWTGRRSGALRRGRGGGAARFL